MERKRSVILAYEQQQAQALAGDIIAKPPLSVWYILIPIIFVFYFMRLSQYSDSVRDFVGHYMKPRRSALDEALAATREKRPPVPAADMTAVPPQAREAYRQWQASLTAHFVDLLTADGRDYDDLVRSAYGSRGSYLMVVNRLNTAERRLETDLCHHVEGEPAAVAKTIDRMAECCETRRLREAERIFP